MATVSKPHAAARGAGQATANPFDVRLDYTRWCRRVHGALAAHPDALLLFDSTIIEPTERLFHALRSHSAGAIADRYESVFARGNRFVAEAVAMRYGVSAGQVICTTGATNAVSMVVRAHVRSGGHVIIEEPNFDLLPYIASEAGASVSYLPRRGESFAPDPAELRERLQPDTRLVLISNLHNPSGSLLDAEQITALAAEAGRVGATLLVDEVYADFARDVYGGCAARLAPNIISVNSLSKVHGLFALRCGWVIAERDAIDRIAEANARDEFGVSKLTHAVASFLLEEGQALDTHWREVLATNRPILQSRADALIADGLLRGAVPRYGCMYFPEVCGVADTWALAAWLWATHGLLVAPGEFFGLPGRVRLGFGGDRDRLSEGLERLANALAEYRGTNAGL